MFLGKKGVLPTLVLVFTLISMGAALFYSSGAIENQKGEVGTLVWDLLNAENKLKNDMIYDGQFLKQSMNNLVIDFADGGLDSTWEDSSSYPSLDEIKEKFELYLNNRLNGEYEVNFVFDSGLTILKLKNIKEYGYDSTNYNISSVGGEEFEFEVLYDFSLLSDSVENLRDVVSSCGDDTSCWGVEASFYWEEDNNLFKVEVPSGIITDAFGEEGVIILGATVDFS